MTNEKVYSAPEMDVYEIVTEGLVCMSGDDSGIDMNPESGNM